MFTNNIFFLHGEDSSVITPTFTELNEMRSVLLEASPYDSTTQTLQSVGFSSGRRTSSVEGISIPFYVRLREDFFFTQLVFPDNLPADRQVSIGQVSINNTDGALDELLDLDWGARTLRLRKGFEFYTYSQHTTIFSGSAIEITATRNDLKITLRDNGHKLQKPLQPNKFTGGGGKEGPIDLRQVAKPLLFGKAKNITPVLLDEVLQLFQIHDGVLISVDQVFDRGVRLTPSLNFATSELLMMAVIPNGSYATCLQEGLIRLGAPAERLTVDAVGSFSSSLTLSEMVRSVLYSRGLTIADLNISSWEEFALDFPYSISGMYYADPSLEVGDWLQNVLSSAFAFFYFDDEGRLAARQFKFRTPRGTISGNKIMSLTRDASPKPIHRVFVDYDRNLTVSRIGDYTLGFQELLVYLKDDKIFVATAADGSGGVYNYVGQVFAFVEEEDVSDTGVVEFRKITSAAWLTLSPNGSFTVSDPGEDVASCTIRVFSRNIYRDVTFTLQKSKGANPANISLASTDRMFVFDSAGLPDPSVQNSVITATIANVATPLIWSAEDNLGRPVALSGTGLSRTLSVSSVVSSQQVSSVTVRVSSADGLYLNTQSIVIYNRSSGSQLSLPAIPSSALQSVRLTVDQAVVKFNSAGVMTPGGQTPVFTAFVNNISGIGAWTFQDNLGTPSATLSTFFSFLSPTTAQAGASLWNTPGRVQVTATFSVGGFSDSEVLLRVDDGSGGLLGYLTNNAHNPPADGSGVVTSYVGSSGKFRVFFNGQEVTNSASYSILANPDSVVTTIDSDGDYAVTASGSWANASNVTTVTYRATYTPPGGSTFTVDQVFSLSKSRAGLNGSGLSIATVFLFQRTATAVAPALPSSTTTYTFLTGVLSGTFSPWSQTIPVSGGQYLWVTLATATADTTTDSILASEWSPASLYGTPGTNGFSSAVIFIYQRAPSAPAAPSGTTTYTFATGVLSGLDNGWSTSVPTSNGNPLWIRTATAFGDGTDTITSGEWTTARILAEDGIDGVDGNQVEFIWRRAASQPATPTGNGIPIGWSDEPPPGVDPLWMSKAKQDLNGALLVGESWSIPIRHDGPPGPAGPSLYEWIAYANSSDGVADFTTGAPQGRAFIGRASNRTTLAESTNPADYQWSQYKGPPSFGLVSRGAVYLASDLIIANGFPGWGAAGVYSSESFTGSAVVSFRGEGVLNTDIMVGLNSDPVTDDSWVSLDYAIYLASDDKVYIYESSNFVLEVPSAAASTAIASISYDGKDIKYYVNNVLVRSVPTSPNRTFFMDSAIASGRVRILNWGYRGLPGVDGTDGIDGADGIFREFVWRRSVSQPSTPTGNGIPVGWFDDPPSGTDPLWMSVAKQELDGTLLAGEVWSTPIRHDGPPGSNGLDALIVTSDITSITIPCDAGGVPLSGALPIQITMKASIGTTDVTGSSTWGTPVMTGCVVNVVGAGQFSIASVGSNSGSFSVTVTNGSRSQKVTVTFAKALAGRAAVSVRDETLTSTSSTTYVTVSDIFILPFGPGQTMNFSVSGAYSILGSPAQALTGRMVARFMYRNVTDAGAWTQAGAEVFGTLATANYIEFPNEPQHIPGTIAGSTTGPSAPSVQKIFEVRLDLRLEGVPLIQSLQFAASIS